MRRQTWRRLGLGGLLASGLVAGSLFALPAFAHEESDRDDDRTALQSQATVTVDQATQTALAQFPGATVHEVKLDDEDGVLVYEVELVDSAGVEHEVKVNATTGAVVATETEGVDDADVHEAAEVEDRHESGEVHEAETADDSHRDGTETETETETESETETHQSGEIEHED